MLNFLLKSDNVASESLATRMSVRNCLTNVYTGCALPSPKDSATTMKSNNDTQGQARILTLELRTCVVSNMDLKGNFDLLLEFRLVWKRWVLAVQTVEHAQLFISLSNCPREGQFVRHLGTCSSRSSATTAIQFLVCRTQWQQLAPERKSHSYYLLYLATATQARCVHSNYKLLGYILS